jgi:hypothetical protein
MTFLSVCWIDWQLRSFRKNHIMTRVETRIVASWSICVYAEHNSRPRALENSVSEGEAFCWIFGKTDNVVLDQSR